MLSSIASLANTIDPVHVLKLIQTLHNEGSHVLAEEPIHAYEGCMKSDHHVEPIINPESGETFADASDVGSRVFGSVPRWTLCRPVRHVRESQLLSRRRSLVAGFHSGSANDCRHPKADCGDDDEACRSACQRHEASSCAGSQMRDDQPYTRAADVGAAHAFICKARRKTKAEPLVRATMPAAVGADGQ